MLEDLDDFRIVTLSTGVFDATPEILHQAGAQQFMLIGGEPWKIQQTIQNSI